nr:hypothetical protein GCM10020092_064270 [Actinoplanes digitatis]
MSICTIAASSGSSTCCSSARNSTARWPSLAIADLDHDGELDLAVFEGASSGLLGSEDMHHAGSVLEPGSSAGILVYENRWAGPFASAIRHGGGRLVASGRIPIQEALAALEASEVSA